MCGSADFVKADIMEDELGSYFQCELCGGSKLQFVHYVTNVFI